MPDTVLRVEGLRWSGAEASVSSLDLSLKAGTVARLRLAADSSPRRLLETLATLRQPLAGQIWVAGHDAGVHGSKARSLLAYLDSDRGYEPRFSAEEHLRLLGSWHGLDSGPRGEVRERYHRWMDAPWPQAPLESLDSLQRLCVRLAVALAHRPALLLAARPLDLLEEPDRHRAARWFSSCAADGCSVLLWDGSAEAAWVADLVVPEDGERCWVEAIWEGSIAAREHAVAQRGLPAQWRSGSTGGACRLGPFEDESQAREAASWLLGGDPAPRELRLLRRSVEP